jgi:hypothetical protein
MKLYDLPERAILELKFLFRNKEYTMNMRLQGKQEDRIFIPTVCSKGQPIGALEQPVITYKTGSGIFIFNDLDMKLVTFSGYYMYSIASLEDVEKINRRETYRVFICEAINFKGITSNGSKIDIYGVLKDISLTGMGLVLNRQYKDLASIEIKIKVNDLSRVTLVGEVINVIKLPKNRGYLYGCRFDGQKDFLSRFLLRRQHQNRIGR